MRLRRVESYAKVDWKCQKRLSIHFQYSTSFNNSLRSHKPKLTLQFQYWTRKNLRLLSIKLKIKERKPVVHSGIKEWKEYTYKSKFFIH